MFDTIMKYLSQQSTWKGAIGLASAVGVAVSPDLATHIVAAGMAVIGIINVLRDETKAK